MAVSAEQRAIYDIVLAAQLAGIKAARPNAPFSAMQDAIVKIITQGLLICAFKRNVNKLIENKRIFHFLYA